MKNNVTPIETVDFRAKQFAEARRILNERVTACKAERDAVMRRHLRGIKGAATACAQYQAELRQELEAHPELFVKPRTITLHGIKVGFQKGKGRIEWADPAKVVELIRRHLGEEGAGLIKVTETPIREALLALDLATLKKIGCTVVETGDQVVIKDTEDAVDKLVARLLADAGEEAEAAS